MITIIRRHPEHQHLDYWRTDVVSFAGWMACTKEVRQNFLAQNNFAQGRWSMDPAPMGFSDVHSNLVCLTGKHSVCQEVEEVNPWVKVMSAPPKKVVEYNKNIKKEEEIEARRKKMMAALEKELTGASA